MSREKNRGRYTNHRVVLHPHQCGTTRKRPLYRIGLKPAATTVAISLTAVAAVWNLHRQVANTHTRRGSNQLPANKCHFALTAAASFP